MNWQEWQTSQFGENTGQVKMKHPMNSSASFWESGFQENLSNRLAVVNNQIEYDWLNKSLNSYKIARKKLFLT